VFKIYLLVKSSTFPGNVNKCCPFFIDKTTAFLIHGEFALYPMCLVGMCRVDNLLTLAFIISHTCFGVLAFLLESPLDKHLGQWN